MSTAMIGALRVVLGLDTAQFTQGLDAAQKELKKASARLQQVGANMAQVGATISAAVTAPLVGLGALAVSEAGEMRSALAQVEASLASMGDKAGRSIGMLTEQADGLAASSLFEDDQILQSVTANMLTFGNISGQAFDRAQQAAVDMATKLKTDLQPATVMIGKALNDPLKGITALSKAGIQFSEDQKAAIRAMVASGDVAGAQAVILKELEKQFGGSAAAARAAAPPMERMRLAFADMAGDIGKILLPVVDRLAKWFERLTAGFGKLSPQMQTAVVIGGALAAALGPVIVAAGAVVASIGALLPVISAVVAGIGTFAAALAAPAAAIALLSPVGLALAGIAAAVAATGAAFLMFRDDVEPVMTRLWAVLQKTLGPALASLFDTVSGLVQGMAGAWKGFFEGEAGRALAKFGAIVVEVMGNLLVRQLAGAVRLVEGALKAIGIAFSILGDLLTLDFSGAWRGVQALVVNAVQTIGNVIKAVFPEALDWARKLAEGVTKWLVGKLGDAMDFVARKARDVGDAFFKLYDRVVGHSYIPDMVDGIADHIGRLEAVMVEPIRQATDLSAERFERMGDRVRSVIEGLLTDRERLDRAFAADTSALEAARKAGEITQSEFDLFSRRNADRYARDRAALPNPVRDAMASAQGALGGGFNQVAERLSQVSGRAAESFGVVADSIQTAFDGAQQAADDFAHRFAGVMERALRGDIKGVLGEILNELSRSLLTSLGRSIAQWGMGQSGWVGSLFKMLPGFATGGSFRVGGSGGVDSQVMAFRATPGEMVDIRKPGQNWKGSRSITFDLSGAVVTADLLAQMNQMIAAGEARAVRASTQIARRGAPALQQRQALLGTT